MVRPDFTKWQQTPEDVLRLVREAEHPRNRERYMALYAIGTKASNATQWAKATGRENETVLGWIHLYNADGPDAVAYRHSGGRTPLFAQETEAELVRVVKTSTPKDHGLPGRGWTLKKLQRWVADRLGRKVSRSALRTILRAAGLRWKRCKKLLANGDPVKRAAFIEQFQTLYERMCRGEVVVIYLDEVHLHQDMEVGYTWSPVGETAWVPSSSPGLSARLNYFGAYNFTDGACFVWEDGKCNGDTTLRFLDSLAAWLNEKKRQVVLIWDGASYHRAQKVRDYAKQLGFEILALPAYSPDLNPIEGLWKWMREIVTQHYCHDSLDELRLDCQAFIDDINQDPLQIINRLWPHFDLDPDVEKLRFSS